MYDVLIIGAGFSGLYLQHKLLESGFTAHILEAGDDVGGTWYWNRYPGARCDVDSVEYQLAFPAFLQEEWTWSERYATQPEIEAYLRFVADRLDLRRHISFGQRVVAAQFDPAGGHWALTTAAGHCVQGHVCVAATGCLSVTQRPNIQGASSFEGTIFHTGTWPAEPIDWTHRRVAVVGTGSSGVQVISALAPQVEHLYVLQRTPVFVFPSYNAPLTAEYIAGYRRRFSEVREYTRDTWGGNPMPMNARLFRDMSEQERQEELEWRWKAGGGFVFLGGYGDMLTDSAANEYAAEFVRKKIRHIVGENALAESLTPRGFPFGTKRICLGTEYYEAFLRPNVSLVDLRKQPLSHITPGGIVCGNEMLAVDSIVLATGFDAMTGALSRIRVVNGTTSLQDRWAQGVETYLGLMVDGFPNFFMITGPGSPSVLSNVVISIEQHVDWIVESLLHMRREGATQMVPTAEAVATWSDHVTSVADATLYPQAASWYTGANIPGKPRRFLPYVGGVHTYRRKCAEIAASGYPGFQFH